MKLVKNKLTTEEWSIYTYLRSECLGEKNAVHMNELAKITNMKERQVRQAISNITRHKPGYTIIAANHNGYFIPTEQERVKANAMLKSRVRGAIERMIANDPAQVNWLYTHIAEIKKQYDAPPQDQIKLEINGKTKDVNYTADKYMKQSLFD